MKTGFIAERAKQLKISSLSISEGLRSGGFSSAFRGQGIEFDSVREYETGDDVRSIDWNLTARSGKTFVKMYREERDLSIFICADFSLSMEPGLDKISPKEKAVETAALLAFAGSHIFSPVGALFFDGEKGPLFVPRTGEDHILAILKSMEDFAFSKNRKPLNGTRIAASMTAASKILRSRSLVIIISDFKVEGYEKQLGLLAAKHDVVCIKIHGSIDSSLPAAGSIRFKDPETNFRMLLPTGSKIFQMEYKKNFAEDISRWENTCKHSLANPVLLDINEDTVKVLGNFFLSKQSNRNIFKNNPGKLRADVWKVF
ncbi:MULTISPECIES: DUF58 domain-containing protein [unclassified Treponema]|uniref:DUF58 domain-containing protein n=1 Tax=unclassified Treponema TaxID=2638727 RepID=UPI0020A3C7A1|nr:MULTISPECIES: DUF58 domain-containing protein [unclassified Treponema]UTC65847.1 DUF58 domain-containing protein [Treponema sp. OMZ 789]UTC68575.1 DUF58 domain-containing protein [Treponema sp. OMZ 790]UTC71305.1 DUF58 domain-containing protein [Treponema sp. OMZ 791]